MNISYPIQTATDPIELGQTEPFIEIILADNTISKIRIDVSLNSCEKYIKFGAQKSRCNDNGLRIMKPDEMVVGIKCIDEAKANEVEENLKTINDIEEDPNDIFAGCMCPIFKIIRSGKQSNVIFVSSTLSTKNLEDLLEHLCCLPEDIITECVNKLGICLNK